jgi:hypothetical protein
MKMTISNSKLMACTKPSPVMTYALIYFAPLLFPGPLGLRSSAELILRVYGYAVSRITHDQIPTGLIWNIRDVTIKVPLRLDNKDFVAWLQDLLNARRATSPPPLVLNDHCQICEYQARCRKQATNEGNLSLLNGMTVNEIAKYNAKGLFTVHQLSYTFRSRRKPKRARPTLGPHYFSLQAQALREKKVFIHGTIDFKLDDPRIYFDIEGTPDAESDYLIGASLWIMVKRSLFHSGREVKTRGARYSLTSSPISLESHGISLFTSAATRHPLCGGQGFCCKGSFVRL